MTERDRAMIEDLEREDRRRTQRDRLLIWAILLIGVGLALLVGYIVTDIDEGVRSIKCETGDVTLVIEKEDGTVERVACPADVPVTP